MSASLFDASIYPDSWFNRHCYHGGMFDKNRVYSTRLALHGINAGNTKGKLVRAHLRNGGGLVGSVISNPTTGEWVTPVVGEGKCVATCLDVSTAPSSMSESKNLITSVPMNGSHGSNSFYDTTGAGACIASNGLTITTAVADPFGGYSGVADFSASNKSLTIFFPNNVGPTGHTSPKTYTLRFWLYLKTLTSIGYDSIVNVGTGAAIQLGFCRNAAVAQLAIIAHGAGVTATTAALPTLNQWVFIEINRSSSNAATTNRIFYSGVLQASNATIHDYYTEAPSIIIGQTWTGYACDFQFFSTTKNTAAYSAPTARIPFGFSGATTTPLIEDDITPL